MTQSSDPRGSNGANRRVPESAPGQPRSQQDTVLLSDVPDAETMRVDPPAADETRVSSRGTGAGRSSNASVHTSNTSSLDLSSAALAALGPRYDILDTAGHGSMGNVYKARDRETGETVALKLLKPEIANDQQMIDRFKNELLFARKITHKNICRVHEFNRVGVVAYTSMEFVEGESLRSVLNRFGAMSLRKGIDLVQQMCSGLKEAHAQGIVHRDLKPENVMIDARGNVKIMDFGIARSMESLTRMTGAMVGTPAYMAPEQVAGKPVDYRTDIYSLGLILYEVFTGKQAFTADNAVAVAMKQLRESPVPPHEVEPGIPAAIVRAIMKALEKEPARRFQSIAEMEKFFGSPSATGVPLASGSTTGGLATQDAFAMRSTGRVSGTGSGRVATLYAPPPKKRSILAGIGKVALVILFAVLLIRGAGRVGELAQLADQVPPPPRPTAPAVPDLAVLEDPSLSDTAPQPATSAPSTKNDTSVATPAPSPQTSAPAALAVATSSALSANAPAVQQAVTPNAPSPPIVQPPTGASAASAAPVQKPAASTGATAVSPSDVQQRADAAFKKNPASNTAQSNAANATATAKQPTGSVVPGNGPSYIWVARFDREDRAQDASRKIQGFGLNSFVMPRREAATGKQFFVVFTGPLQPGRIPSTIDWLKSQGFDNVREVKGIGAGALNGRGANSQPASSGNDE